MAHIHVTLAPDTPPAKLLALARVCLRRAGVAEDRLPAQLAKARSRVYRRAQRPVGTFEGEASHPLATPELDHAWQRLEAWGALWPDLSAHQLASLVDDDALSLVKAWSWHWRFPLSDGQWGTVKLTLDRLASAAVNWLSGATPRSDRDQPGIPPEALLPGLHDIYGDATRLGMASSAPSTPQGLMPPLTDTERAAVTVARRHAGARLTPVLRGFHARMEARLLEIERQAVQRRTAAALGQREGPQALASVLAAERGHFQRDWQRVARTELADAFNQGAVATLIARHPTNQVDGQPVEDPKVPAVKVLKIPSVNACLHCKRIWLQPDGAPRLYNLVDVLAHTSNEGLPAAQWSACVGPSHPNCACSNLLEYVPAVEPTFERMRIEHATRS